MPPSLHWVVVWLLGGITLGLFQLIWCFKQAGFVKKIDPASKATLFLTLALIGQLVLVLGAVGMVVVSSSSGGVAGGVASVGAIMGIVGLLILLIGIFCLVAIFGMRGSLVRYYNTVEPMGLRLSGVMTFFFSFLYFQYHMSRIARWKKTGVLS